MSWSKVSLDEICSPKQWPTLSKAEMSEQGFPVFGANGAIGFTDKITHADPTILIGCRGSCGTVHITPPNAYANGNAMALDRLDSGRIDLNFLAAFLRCRGFVDVISGSSQPQIIRQNIVRIEIPLPPLDEQKRIAAILDQADELRRLRQRAIDRLSELGQTIFYEMFGDPATNPKNLPTRPLGELIKVSSGMGLTSANQNGGDYPVYGGNGINGWHDKYTVAAGTIVIGRVGVYCGVIHITEQEAWVTDNALIVTKKKADLNTAYLAAALKYANLNQYAGRSAQPLVSGSRIYPIHIAVPANDDQFRFERRLMEHAKVVVASLAHLSTLDRLFSCLQSRAFSGEL